VVSIRAARLHRLASAWMNRRFLKQFSVVGHLKATRMPRDIAALQVQELTATCLPALLKYEDRNSMAFSVEARLPMLDYRLVELALGLPWEFKIREGWTKCVLREVAQSILPHEVAWRRNKFGFMAPQQLWMDLLRPQIQQMVRGELACAGLVDVDRLRKGLAKGVLPDRALWRFFNLEHWMRLFSVQCA
jgi:asparagine synthase (glutamine-hydrolysing)